MPGSTSDQAQRSRRILLVDDSPDDRFFFELSFKRMGAASSLQSLSGAHEALDYLHGEGVYADRLEYPLPTLLVTDLNMPGVNGFELIERVRQHPGLSSIPIVVLTNSSLAADQARAHQLGAVKYIVKPASFALYTEVIRAVEGCCPP